MFFDNRTDAGLKLVQAFREDSRTFEGWTVIGLARGGVPVAAEVARELELPLHALCVDDLKLSDNSGKLVITGLGTASLHGKIAADLGLSFLPSLATPTSSAASREFLAGWLAGKAGPLQPGPGPARA